MDLQKDYLYSQRDELQVSLGIWLKFIAISLITMLLFACGGGGSGSDGSVVGDSFDEIVMRTGPIQAVRVGQSVTLDASKSYMTTADSGTALGASSLQFEWSFTHKPQGSQADLQNPSTMNPSFTPDMRGVYIAQVIGSGNGLTGPRAISTVVVTLAPERLTGPWNHLGLSNQCVDCHSGDLPADTSGRNIPGKSVTHIATSLECEACHTPQDFATIPFVDHLEVFDDCSGCHNGVNAVGKSDFHVETNAECNDCHNTTSFLELDENGNFDHSGITRVCSGCHNGTVAIGMTPMISEGGTHPDTTTECGFCHTTVSFQNAYPDHTTLTQSCDSCHGVSARGEPLGHPDFGVSPDCDTCHTIVSFDMGGVFNHTLVDTSVLSCASCHDAVNNSIGAIGKDAGHINTTADCGSCHYTSPQKFTPAFGIDHSDPIVTSQQCDACHNGTDATGTVDAPHSHLDLNLVTNLADRDCGTCHQAGGTFTTGTLDHALVGTASCEACHNNDVTVGALPNHFPISGSVSLVTGQCADCHSTTAFAPATFNHTDIISGSCSDCHGGGFNVLGKSINHIPTTQDCASCHNTTNANFSPSIFTHAGINSGCHSCHNGSFVDVGSMGATAKPSNHIPASNVCEDCHTSTASFTPQTLDHSGITQGCAGCHSSSFPAATDKTLAPTPPGHVPTDADCSSCHAKTGWAPALAHDVTHADLNSNCSSCHDGTFSSLGALSKMDDPSPPHITTAEDCFVCHSNAAFSPAFVDHSGSTVQGQSCASCHDGITATGKGDDPTPPHPTTTEDCGACHQAGGAFKPAIFNHDGIVDNCVSCHQGLSVNGITGKDDDPTPPHPTTTEDCSVCHNTTSFAGAQYDHSGIDITQVPPTSNPECQTCHNGNQAPGKIPPPGHVPTSEDCVVCHQTTGFIPGGFDHTGIVDNCSSCHGAGFAIGKPLDHVFTAQDCGVCHNTTTFVGAVFDHTGIVDNCSSCHNGSTATGKHNDHLATALDCHFCHTTATFVGGSWVHDSSTAGTCDTCHNGSSATGKSIGHLNTTSQCDVCHSTNAWAPDIFSHDPYPNYPGDHRRSLTCTQCHGSVISGDIPWPFPQYQPFCAACHANDFEPKDKHIGGKNGTIEQNKDCSGSGCHRVSDNEFG